MGRKRLLKECNKLKIAAGKKFCDENGLIYQILTEDDLTILTSIEVLTLEGIEWNKGAREYLEKQC